MTAFGQLLLAETRVLLRNWVALFFTLLFPLIFIVIFGFLLSDVGEVDRSRMGLFLVPGPEGALLEGVIAEAGAMEVVRYETVEGLEADVGERAIDFGLAWDGGTLRSYLDPSRVQENYAFEQVVQGIQNDFDLRRHGLTPPIAVEAVHVGTSEATGWFNLVVPGILAFSILSTGLFAVSGHLTEMKERRTLDRMIVTPMRPVALLVAIAVVRLILAFLSTLVTLSVAMLLFDLSFDVSWPRYALFVACATLGTMGLGTVIALLVRKPSSAFNIANALAMSMMFLAGIYFPAEFMPGFLQAIGRWLPLTHMADVMRYVTGVLEMSDARYWTTTAVFLAMAIVLFPILGRYVVRPLRQ